MAHVESIGHTAAFMDLSWNRGERRKKARTFQSAGLPVPWQRNEKKKRKISNEPRMEVESFSNDLVGSIDGHARHQVAREHILHRKWEVLPTKRLKRHEIVMCGIGSVMLDQWGLQKNASKA